MSEKVTMVNDLTTGSVSRKMFQFALPLLLSGVLQILYNMVDMMVVGQAIGKVGISAVSISSDIFTLLTLVAIGFCNAGQIVISQHVGAGDMEQVKHLIGTMFTLITCCAVAIGACFFIGREKILRWMNTSADAWDYAYQYVTVCIFGLVFVYDYNVVSAILRGLGDSKHPFMFISIAVVLNLILDLLFVCVFHYGVFGAALATVLSQSVSFLLALAYLYRSREEFVFDFRLKSFAIQRKALLLLLKLGIPMVLQLAAVDICKVFVSSWINAYGVVASSINGIGGKLTTIVNVVSQAVGAAGASMIGQSLGAQVYDRVSKILKVSYAALLSIACVVSLVVILFPQEVFGLFTTDLEVVAMGASYVPVLVLTYVACALRQPMFALINGSGNSKLNLIVALVDGIIARIGLAVLLARICGMGLFGYWYGNALAGFVPFLVGFIYYLSGNWRSIKVGSGERGKASGKAG